MGPWHKRLTSEDSYHQLPAPRGQPQHTDEFGGPTRQARTGNLPSGLTVEDGCLPKALKLQMPGAIHFRPPFGLAVTPALGKLFEPTVHALTDHLHTLRRPSSFGASVVPRTKKELLQGGKRNCRLPHRCIEEECLTSPRPTILASCAFLEPCMKVCSRTRFQDSTTCCRTRQHWTPTPKVRAGSTGNIRKGHKSGGRHASRLHRERDKQTDKLASRQESKQANKATQGQHRGGRSPHGWIPPRSCGKCNIEGPRATHVAREKLPAPSHAKPS